MIAFAIKSFFYVTQVINILNKRKKMKKQNLILSAALAAVFSASTAFAEAEVTGKIIHESAKFTTSGTTIGAATAHGKDAFKQETSARIYIDGAADELQEGATYHVELNLMKDGKATSNYDSNESYTQRDALREAYVDFTVDDWSIRAGKQQVVWGTADGMKLLDMINPSDYGEMAQNQMEDSRIPVWMINAETTNANGSEFQVVVSQPRENVFAGLNRGTATGKRQNAANGQDLTTDNGTDTGNAFVMMGPDSITGEVNGFLNIVPDLASVAGGFVYNFSDAAGGTMTLKDMMGITVGQFAGMTNAQIVGGMQPMLGANGAQMNASIDAGYDGAQILGGFASNYNTNLSNGTSATDFGVNKDSAFEYMGNATFSTFDAFAGASSQYVYNMPKDDEVDFAIKTSQTTKNGVSYSLNYSHSFDKNPIIDISWKGVNGENITTTPTTIGWIDMSTPVAPGAGNYDTTTLSLTGDISGDSYGASGNATEAANLVFEQSVVRTNNIGGSFDTAIETAGLGPVVIRGEVLYTTGGKQPVIDKALFAIGDLPGALTMQDADRFKFVLGADITVLTNMLISGQYITDRNLDFIDGNKDTGIYTTDYATMHLSNGFNKAIKDKQYYSLFFSKPFGASGEHRWNNITMFEENGGKWNRLDAEFSIDDDTQATVEWNKYFGDENTQFGQLSKSSNIQVGVKYSF